MGKDLNGNDKDNRFVFSPNREETSEFSSDGVDEFINSEKML